MTPRRVAALAQALAIVSIVLVPGTVPGDHAVVRAAIAPPPPDSVNVFDATGKGIGCQRARSRFKGPRNPKDPPWPPGAKPTPSPSPSPSPSPEPTADPSSDPFAESSPTDEPTADAAMMLLAATGVRVAQAEPVREPTTPLAQDGDAEIVPDATSRPRNKRGRNSLLSGIDVSHHNGDIDYKKVRADGNRFVFIKATQDTSFIDPLFPTNMARARDAGLAAGGYHFFDYTIDGKAQADHFLDRLEAGNGLDGALPPVVDVECWAPIGSSTHVVAAGRLRDFVERVYERTGRLPMVYTSVFMWKQVVGNAEGFERLPLWAACWGCADPPSLAPGWDSWAFWQTGVNRVRGVGRLDGNYFSGSKADLNRLKLRPLAIDGGAEATSKLRVELDLGGRDARHIRTSLDGEQWTKWAPVRSRARAELPADEGEQTLFVQLRAGPGLRSPTFSDSITLDLTGPEITRPTVSLREGLVGSGPAGIPVSVDWEARDELAGLSDATVSVNCGEGQVQRTEAPGSAAPDELVAWHAAADLFAGATCDVVAISRDGVGNTARSSAKDIEAAVMPTPGGVVTDRAVTGSQVGIVAQRGPDAGRAAVMLDGQPVGLFDLYAPAPTGLELVFVADLDGQGSHALSIEPTGTADPASAGTAVSIDSLVTLTR